MDKFINFNAYPLSDRDGTYGGRAGLKDGILYEDEYWIIKYPKITKDMRVKGVSYTTAPLSEYIGSHIYEILGFDTHKTLLGHRNNKVVVACKDFCADGAILLETRTIKNAVNPELADRLDRDFSSTGSAHFVNLEELLLHLEHNRIMQQIPNIKERFWDCVIIDALINNNDRNNGNWGILRKNGKDVLAPVFDNGASFSNKVPDEKIEKWLHSEEAIAGSALNTTTSYEWNGKPLVIRQLFELDLPDFQDAVLRNIPKIMGAMPQISAFMDSIPHKQGEFLICSPERANFYRKSMECRLERIMLPCYNKLTSVKFDKGPSANSEQDTVSLDERL